MFRNILRMSHHVRIDKETGLLYLSSCNIFNMRNKYEKTNNTSGTKATSYISQEIPNLQPEIDAIISAFPDICEEILNEQLACHKHYPELRARYYALLDYTLNLNPMYLSRPIFILHAYKLLENPSLLTKENLKKACILGWCQKLVEASALIYDDIADGSAVRYNKQAWYTLKNVGVGKAILDAAFLHNASNLLIARHFKTHPQFYNIQKSFFKNYAYLNVAQVMDIQKCKLEELEYHQDYVKCYSFTVPLIESTLYLSNIDDTDTHVAAEELCKEFARFLKIEDDVSGVFSASDTQKTCTDIIEGRPSWLLIEAYKRGNKTQRKLLEDNYSRNNEESINIVYNILRDLKLEEVFIEFRADFYDKMLFKIHESLPKTLPPQLFINLLNYMVGGHLRI